MLQISDKDFEKLIDEALSELPQKYVQRMKNSVAIVQQDDPTPEQRHKLQLRGNQTLLGLYEGLPLTQRYSGYTTFLPDKITIFKHPACAANNTIAELKESIKHTMWHEMAHYFGLDHPQIHALE